MRKMSLTAGRKQRLHCSGKIFFSIWAARFTDYMLANGYFNRQKQKGFLRGISGCSEHASALREAMEDSRRSKRQLAMVWIDLKNAFGSVPHNLIQFALEWYHVPPVFEKIIRQYYDMLVATIEGRGWSSQTFPFELGVFQGCTISPLLFNLVFNLLLDLLTPLSANHGYSPHP